MDGPLVVVAVWPLKTNEITSSAWVVAWISDLPKEGVERKRWKINQVSRGRKEARLRVRHYLGALNDGCTWAAGPIVLQRTDLKDLRSLLLLLPYLQFSQDSGVTGPPKGSPLVSHTPLKASASFWARSPFALGILQDFNFNHRVGHPTWTYSSSVIGIEMHRI